MSEDVKKERDIGSIVRHLVATYNKAANPLERAFRSKSSGPNLTYRLDTEFAYRLNEVMQGPRALLQQNVQACNEHIDDVLKQVRATEEAKTQKA